MSFSNIIKCARDFPDCKICQFIKLLNFNESNNHLADVTNCQPESRRWINEGTDSNSHPGESPDPGTGLNVTEITTLRLRSKSSIFCSTGFQQTECWFY